jgi:hypothetical protein
VYDEAAASEDLGWRERALRAGFFLDHALCLLASRDDGIRPRGMARARASF